MKRILIASAVAFAAGGQAFAADLPPPMAPPPRAPAMYVPVVPLYNWTGFYIGGNVGAGWNSTGSITDTFGSTFGTTTHTSFLGGGQVGVNYEFGGGVVVGAEAMFDWLPNTSNTINATGAGAATGSTAAATINNRWLTTATGKLGYAWDRVLLYGKGGGAWVGTSNPSITVNGAPASFSTNSANNFGWTAGLGVEWAFAGNWSARAEWDYVRLQNQSYTVASTAPGGFANDVIRVNNRSINMFTAGLNYKFGGGWW
jgi:outer membrane immunogenic protein